MTRTRLSLVALGSLFLTLLPSPSIRGQSAGDIPWGRITPAMPFVTPPAITDSTPSFYKRKAEWKKIIDEYWGPGVPLQEKQRIFNAYADYIQRYFTVFEGLGISWDSLRAHYYSQINDLTSHGRFSSILSYLAYYLRELHTAVLDFSLMSDGAGDSVVVANPTWGKPVWFGSPMPNASHFGAVLTPAADSSAIVIHAIQNHPLGLKPGDVVLGYEGVPWRKIAREFLAAEIPSFSLSGGSRSMEMHHLLWGAGFNWHLFDTIDIVKYPTGDTLHLPVDTLATIRMTDVMYNNESLKIPGVPWPDWNWTEEVPNTAPVTHGIVEGTNIGYIYVSLHTWRFQAGNLSPDSDQRFSQAVAELWNTDGLIIDLRHDHGGRVKANFKSAFGKMLNFDTHTLEYYQRASASDLTALAPFTYYDPAGWMYIDADEETVYDRPIAVLVGPECMSVGDVTAYRLSYFPNTRFFGKSTSMGWAGENWTGQAPQEPGYRFAASDMVFRDHYDPGRDLERTEFPVDEEVWLTQEDVARGDDTVVKRALAWIKGVAHAHDVTPSSRYYTPVIDTLRLTAQVENPNNHPISVKAYIKRDATVVDSVAFADDGLPGDGKAGDGLWGTSWKLPAGEEMYNATVVTTDPVDKSVYSMPFSARFTSAGPIVFQHLSARKVSGDLVVFENPAVCNRGVNVVLPNVTGTLRKLEGDTVIDRIYNSSISYGDIPPDSVIGTSRFYSLTLRYPVDSIRLGVDLASNGFTYWTDTLTFYFPPGAVADKHLNVIPIDFALHQNYPNPFNPTTTIRYDVAGRGGYQSSGQASVQGANHVRLAVYDLLGREVAVLVDEGKAPGVYEVQFDAKGMASGVYLYKLTAGSFVQSRRMILIR